MQTRQLGNSDLQITPIGFGAWAIGGSGWEYGWGSQEDLDSIAAIHKALDLGINWIDTAAVYGTGHSEEVVAQALKTYPGKKPYVFTKCTLIWDKDRKVRPEHSAASIKQECEASLSRLQIAAIDLYQMHWPPPDNGPGLEAAWTAMKSLQQDGKVRWIGVSNFNVDQMKRAEKIAPITSNQPQYNVIRRQIETEILPYCEQQNIAVIPYSPMASGLLTGAMTKDRAAQLPPDDFRSRNAEFQEPRLSINMALVERLRQVGQRHGKTPGEVAIAWTLRNPVITGTIVGARSPQQIEGIVGAATLRLTEEEIAEVEGAAMAAGARR